MKNDKVYKFERLDLKGLRGDEKMSNNNLIENNNDIIIYLIIKIKSIKYSNIK